MLEEIFKIIGILLLTMLKFIAGPTLGYGAGFSLVTTIVITVCGMMSAVLLFTFFGKVLREKVLSRFFRNRKRFTKRNRRFVRVWKRYGINGVALLTPIIFTPIGGTILLSSFGTPPEKIIYTMLVSATFWGTVFSTAIYIFDIKVLFEL